MGVSHWPDAGQAGGGVRELAEPFVYTATFIVEPSCRTSSIGQPASLGKHVGKVNWIEPSGRMWPRATVHSSGVCPTTICSSLLLTRYVSRVPENTPATRPELVPFPMTL